MMAGANIVNLGGGAKAKLFKVGTITLEYGANRNKTSATLNIKSIYPNYDKLTIDDICFPITYSKGWHENYPNSDITATLTNFKKSYSPSTGVITVSATGSHNYNNTTITCDIFVLDRYNTGG